MADEKAPHDVDVYVGRTIRARRVALGMSQETLGEAIGVTFQQVQKYERAANRVSCSKLVEIAGALRCSAADLLPGPNGASADLNLELRLAGDAHGRELAEAYLAMPSQFRTSLLHIARSLTSSFLQANAA